VSGAADDPAPGDAVGDLARLEQLVQVGPAVLYRRQAAPPHRLTYLAGDVGALLGITARELLADEELLVARLHPDDAGRVVGTEPAVEYRLRLDGQWIWVRDERRVLPGPDGRPAEVAGSLRDVTDRRRTEERAGRMQELTGALAAALTPAQIADAALPPAVAVLGAHGGGLVLRDPPEPDGAPARTLSIAGAFGYHAAAVDHWRRVPLDGSTPAADAVLSGEPCYLGTRAEAAARYPTMFAVPASDSPLGSWAALPLRAGGEVIGALTLSFVEPRTFPADERTFLETVAAQCALSLERTRLYETAHTERERLRAVLARLPVGVIIAAAPSGRLVLGNDEVEHIWRQPSLRSAGAGGDDGYHGFHPDGRPYRPEEWPLARALRSGEVVGDEEIDIERGDGSRGTVVVNSAPIRDPDGSVTGAVCTFLDITERAESRRRLAGAYAAERAARAEAEAAWRRLDRLQRVTAALSEAVTVEQVAEVIVQGGLSVLGCRSAWIGVLDEPGEELVALAASFPLEPGGPAARIPLDAASPRAEVTRTGQPVWLPSTADALQRYPGLRAVGIFSGALGVVPLVSHGRPVGAMALSFGETRELEPEERALVVTLADQCAQALERAQLHQRERDVAVALQQSMLPSALPAVPGLQLAGRYRASVESLEVGGDWYDVLALPDGLVGLVVGDVVGRGLGAATTMGQLRSALAAVALTGRSPARVVDDLELFARQVEGAQLGTVVYCVLDPVRGSLRYSCAGHPPPLVLFADGSTEYLPDGRSPLLCALPPGLVGPRAEGEYVLPPGATLLLYSDGLVERRRESLDIGLRRLATLAAQYVRPGDDSWCERLVDAMVAGSGDDDVALLRITFRPVFTRRLPAQPHRLARLRGELRGWLAGVGASDDEVTDVLLACGEACANAVEHAYRDGGDGELTVELALDGDRELRLRVADTGRWRTVPAPGDRGRGLPLMRAVMDAVDVARGRGGTVVTMRRRLGLAVPG
jgi:serine phosphatase RsbU (regulator of sigma subunit)/anti-sigma regulatory factor (Ser/Thr protein kinase)/PAS domain-containing protein